MRRAGPLLLGALLALLSALRAHPAVAQAQAESEREAEATLDSIGPADPESPAPRPTSRRLPWGADYLAFANAPEFLPRSYLYLSTKTGSEGHRVPLLFAAEYALHLAFFNNLRTVALEGRRLAFAATAFFRGDLRMVRVGSKPVRMPSYKPGLALQAFWIQRASSHRRWLLGARLEGYHYSNGQERCTWDAELADEELDSEPRGPCAQRFDQLASPQDELNRVSGEFSTNRLLLGFDVRDLHLDATSRPAFSWSVGALAESNRPHGPGGIARTFRDLYGWGSFELHGEAEGWLGSWARLRLRATYVQAIDSGANVPTASGSLEAALYPPARWFGDFGLFARYYGGRDFYNAFFVDRVQTFQFGFVWDDHLPFEFGER